MNLKRKARLSAFQSVLGFVKLAQIHVVVLNKFFDVLVMTGQVS